MAGTVRGLGAGAERFFGVALRREVVVRFFVVVRRFLLLAVLSFLLLLLVAPGLTFSPPGVRTSEKRSLPRRR